MSKKFIIKITVLILILIGSGYAVNKYLASKNQVMPDSIIKLSYEEYLDEAMKYRTEGFAGDVDAFYKAIDSYKKALEVSKEKSLVYLNLGNTYRLVKDYNSAEKAYNKALEILPSEDSAYLAKIEMYRYELKKSNSEIEEIYNKALKEVTDNANVMVSYAAFLRDIGNGQEALKYYKILEEKYPDSQAYKDEIEELKAK